RLGIDGVNENPRLAIHDRVHQPARSSGDHRFATGRGLEAHDPETLGATTRGGFAAELHQDIAAPIQPRQLVVRNLSREHDVVLDPDAARYLREVIPQPPSARDDVAGTRTLCLDQRERADDGVVPLVRLGEACDAEHRRDRAIAARTAPVRLRGEALGVHPGIEQADSLRRHAVTEHRRPSEVAASYDYLGAPQEATHDMAPAVAPDLVRVGQADVGDAED